MEVQRGELKSQGRRECPKGDMGLERCLPVNFQAERLLSRCVPHRHEQHKPKINRGFRRTR
jgi:hypothetical protein